MSLFGRKEKQELAFLRSQMTPQQLEVADLTMKIKSAQEELADITAKIAKESSALMNVFCCNPSASTFHTMPTQLRTNIRKSSLLFAHSKKSL